MILAAIDIGSNAARLLIQEVSRHADGSIVFTKLNLIRFPLRLGIDVFKTGIISDERKKMMLDAMQIYAITMNMYQVSHFRACATSAMRDAKNGKKIIDLVYKKTGIPIEIISGAEEAQMVYENHAEELLNHQKPYLYIDVGGGSTELTLIQDQQVLFKESINIGTIRLLNNQVNSTQWNAFKKQVQLLSKDIENIVAIGSGGNINKIFSLSKTKDDKSMPLALLETYYRSLSHLSVEERISKYKMREDRADVIVPALKIYTMVMKYAGIREIYVPKIGVSDGIIKSLYQDLNNT